jgi:hypothetical protein
VRHSRACRSVQWHFRVPPCVVFRPFFAHPANQPTTNWKAAPATCAPSKPIHEAWPEKCISMLPSFCDAHTHQLR